MVKIEKEIKNEMFENVVAFSLSEPGAMGPAGIMCVLNQNGNIYHFNFLSEETPYSKIKEYFPLLEVCYWNGPMIGEFEGQGVVCLGRNNSFSTKIPSNFYHLYLDLGNHLCIRKDVYEEAAKLLKDMDNCDITFDWGTILEQSNIINSKTN